MKSDIVWLDYARTIGIFLVIFGHSIQFMPGWDTSFLHGIWDYIYLFHMPLFFIISGYLYKKIPFENWRQGGGKICRQLIFPFLIYQTIFLPIALWDHRQIIFDNSEWIKFLIGFIGGDGYNTPVSYYICLPCWFIVCIIQLRLLFLFVDINEFTTCFLIIFSVAFLTIRNVKQWDLFFCIDSTIDAIPYFLLGYYMKSKNVLEQHNTNIKYKLILVFAFAILIYLFLHENGASQMNRPSSGRIVIIDYVAGFVGSFMVFYLSQVLATIFGGKEWIKRISRNTLFIIFSHFLLLLPVGRLLRSVLKCENSFLSIVCALCVSLVVLFVSMLMINKWQEKFPVLFGKYK